MNLGGINLISYDWVEIRNSDDYQQLDQYLDWEFQPKAIVKQLQSQITDAVKFVLIEHGYTDKDYRSTYYNYYVKKGRRYRDDCVRLHFFDSCVAFDKEQMELNWNQGNLEEHYFGFVVVRPTISSTLGRSILSPNIRVGASGMTIQSRHQVHLLGYTLSVSGFPSMAQHTDIAVCAHVACWSILRHYSEQYSQHRELLLHDITKLAAPFDPGGLTPSLGLSILDAERIFQMADCFPLFVAKDLDCELQFFTQMLAYLESGFPLFVALNSIQHAIVVTGYAWHRSEPEQHYENLSAWKQVDKLLAVDDNLLPHSCVEVRVDDQSENTTQYTVDDFDAFIVPLPEKIHYPASAIDSFTEGSFYSSHREVFELPNSSELIRRFFVTTISALRRFAREHRSQLGEKLVSLLMHLRTAQFIWVAEYATKSQWNQGHIAARAIIDATASPSDDLPIWVAHSCDLAVVYDRSSTEREKGASVLELDRQTDSPLSRFEQNLRPVIK